MSMIDHSTHRHDRIRDSMRGLVYGYLEDALTLLLKQQQESQGKESAVEFVGSYFQGVLRGDHILFRDYGFVQATPRNRRAFIRMFWRCFRHLGSSGEMYTSRDYHMLVCLLCKDFPMAMIHASARAVLVEDSLDMLMSFVDFLYAFQVQLFYHSSLAALEEEFGRQRDVAGGALPVTAVVAAYQSSPGADQDIVEVVRGVTADKDRFDHFAEVLHRLVSSDAVTAHIGALPKRSMALTVDIEEELAAAMAAEPEPEPQPEKETKKKLRRKSTRS